MSSPDNDRTTRTTRNNIKNLHEMVFIYNAVMDGWTVRRLRNGKIRLKKKTRNSPSISRIREEHYVSNSEQNHIQQYDLELVDFIQNNVQVDRIFE